MEKSKSGFFFILLLCFVIIVSVLIIFFFKDRFSPSKVLPDGSFYSDVQKREMVIKDKNGDNQTIVYYVIVTKQNYSQSLYGCSFILEANGTRTAYQGYFRDYSEQNCKIYSGVRENYDCRLRNWLNHFLNYDGAVSIRKFNPGTLSEISVSRFIVSPVRPQISFLSKNNLSDMYSYSISCRTSTGRQISHAQIGLSQNY